MVLTIKLGFIHVTLALGNREVKPVWNMCENEELFEISIA